MADIYVFIPCIYDKNIPASCDNNISLMNNFLQELKAQSEYECSTKIYSELDRSCLGKFDFICTADEYKELKDNISIDVYLILTKHQHSPLCTIMMIFPGADIDITMLQDQMSTNHMYIRRNGEIFEIEDFLAEQFAIQKSAEAKCLICLKEKPSHYEMRAMLASEAANSAKVSYHLREAPYEEALASNIAMYDFYDCYVSARAAIYILHTMENTFEENMDEEIAMVFIMELILFQFNAISHSDRIILSHLTNVKKLNLKEIEKIYIEFGKTIMFWDVDNFKYLTVQILSDRICQAFKLSELQETYYRNLDHLEHIVELRTSQNSEREGKIINVIAILLALIQILPLLYDVIRRGHLSVNGAIKSAISMFVVIFFLLLVRRYRRKKMSAGFYPKARDGTGRGGYR
jgi:hypothetical protein